ncbi:hypothetical protein Fmac_019895 [Flemingia macrophylla]|uniref:Protein kinase domain-containing protein n=1 Tax=Flemingia macrophylla TaxID=520843 RepID=A0ABD1M989_9FABA
MEQPEDQADQFYVYMHFTEIQVLAKNQTREFSITQNGKEWDLSSSGLSGKIDPSISKLTMLEKLDLSNNSLNGEIPDFLSKLQNLKILNLENNNLSGSIPPALKEGSLSIRVCQNPHIHDSGQCNQKNKKKNKNIVIPLAASVSGVLILLVVVAAILWTLKSRKLKALMVVEKDHNQISSQYTEQDDSLLEFNKQKYSYSAVLNITNNFNTIVGKGGFGTVYLGYIDDTPVAVKMLSPSSVHGYQQFQAEVKLLMTVHHRNLTSLVGYCNEGTNKGLIYEYMANGNLQEHLSGLEYLQNGCKPPIIHRDVKSTNILLNEYFQAKLSDFGLSKIMPTDCVSHVSTVIAGTPGYLDPDYCISNRLTEKSDIYSFGIVLLEIITSQPVITRREENIHIIEWVSSLIAKGDIRAIVDSRLEAFDSNSAWKVVKIAMACISPKPSERPLMKTIVAELVAALPTELAPTKHIDADITRDLAEIFQPLLTIQNNPNPSALSSNSSNTGFISIDCGAPADANYTQSYTGISYISDANFINTGVRKSIVSELRNEYQNQMWDVRSFPDGKRNCYKINITRGTKYLIRTTHLYGNYDGLDMPPQFDLLLGPNQWKTVAIQNSSREQVNQIIHVPSLDCVQICLVNTGYGTPFISSIELRPLKNNTYVTQFGSLEIYSIWDLGSNISRRYKDDVYDRFWSASSHYNAWRYLNVLDPSNSLDENDYKPPTVVMNTAVSPANVSAPLVISWTPKDENEQYYFYMHFTEIQVIAKNDTREFNIILNDVSWYENLSPRYRQVNTIYSRSAFSGKEIRFSLEMTKNSTLPPLINAMEIYREFIFQRISRKDRPFHFEPHHVGEFQYTQQDDSLRQPKKQIYSYSDVLKITNNFNTIIGKGGFGTVYLGYIDDTPVAVKMLSPTSVRGYQQFQAEVNTTNQNSLAGKTDFVLHWMQPQVRKHTSNYVFFDNFVNFHLNVFAINLIPGLEYLQNGCKPPIIHRDVKSSNILLNEHLQAKLSDFGLSKIIPTDGESHVSTVVAGTLGYLDPQ